MGLPIRVLAEFLLRDPSFVMMRVIVLMVVPMLVAWTHKVERVEVRLIVVVANAAPARCRRQLHVNCQSRMLF